MNKYSDMAKELPRMSVEQIVEALKRLRSIREQADAAFLCFLVRVEQTHSARLKDWGYDSFERFVELHKLVNVARYRDFAAGLRRLEGGEDEAIERGAEAVIIAAKLTSDAAVPKFMASVGDWVNESGGVRPCRRTAMDIARKIDPVIEVPGPTKRMSELQRVKQRCAELEAENRQLKSKLRKYEKSGAKAA